MSLDLIIKLVKLANNNPNEHEANLAARKACKLIESSKILETKQSIPPKPSNPQPPKPPNRPPPYNPNVRNPFQEYYENTRRTWKGFDWDIPPRQTREKPKEKEEPKKSGFEYVYYDEMPNFEFKDLGSIGKRRLRCKTCKQTKETTFVGVPEMFECNECAWDFIERIKRKGQKK